MKLSKLTSPVALTHELIELLGRSEDRALGAIVVPAVIGVAVVMLVFGIERFVSSLQLLCA
jgi:hypothetical protein